jgi:hypothetical protein
LWPVHHFPLFYKSIRPSLFLFLFPCKGQKEKSQEKNCKTTNVRPEEKPSGVRMQLSKIDQTCYVQAGPSSRYKSTRGLIHEHLALILHIQLTMLGFNHPIPRPQNPPMSNTPLTTKKHRRQPSRALSTLLNRLQTECPNMVPYPEDTPSPQNTHM